MLLTGWNMKDALVVAREEGTEDGIEIGRERGRAEGIGIGEERGREELLALLESGISLAEAKRKLNLSHHP
jgi:flagellar biosynthesis/type III secretory pathway protein FliH